MTGQPDVRVALAALEAVLARRAAALIDEVAHYPTPIARCDEQRTQAIAQLRAVRDLAAAAAYAAPREWLERVGRWLEGYASTDDADEAASVAHARSVASAAAEARP